MVGVLLPASAECVRSWVVGLKSYHLFSQQPIMTPHPPGVVLMICGVFISFA